MKVFIKCLTLTLLFSHIWSQSESENFGFEIQSRYLAGGGYDTQMKIEGNILYTTFGNTLGIFDATNLEQLEQLSYILLPGSDYNEPIQHVMQIGNDICRITSIDQNDGIHQTLVNVSNPSSPEVISQNSYEFGGHTGDAVFEDNYIYYRSNNVVFIDSLAADGEIVSLSNYNMSQHVEIDGIARDRLILRSDPNYSVYLLDLTDKYALAVTDTILFDSESYRSINICGDYLFITDESSGTEFIDISQSGNFQTVYTSATPLNYQYPTMRGDYLYTIAARADSVAFEVIDFSDPSSPQTIASKYIHDGGFGGFSVGLNTMSVGADYAVIHGAFYEVYELGEGLFRSSITDWGIKCIDLTENSDPVLHVAQRGPAHQMEHSSHGLWILGFPWNLLDIDDPTPPTSQGHIGQAVTPQWNYWSTIENNLLINLTYDESVMEDTSLTIDAYDLTNPLNPELIGSINLELSEYGTQAIVVKNSTVYLAWADSLYTIDLSNPVQPELTSSLYTGRFRHLEVSKSGDLIYGIVDDQYVLAIIDVSTPLEPEITGTYDSEAHEYAVDGDIGFSLRWSGIHDGSFLIQRLDISDPQNVIELDSFLSGQEIWGDGRLWLSGSFLYLYSLGVLEVFDISVAGQEIKIGRYETVTAEPFWFFRGYGIRDIIAENGTVYLLNDLDGLHIITHSTATVAIAENSNLPRTIQLSQNHPNPFNPTTTINYSLPELSIVRLTVFDMLGREVTKLYNAEKPPGNYEVQWNGLDQEGNQLSTGVYFCRLDAGSVSQTIKMVYLR